jgi:hypothetical protein
MGVSAQLNGQSVTLAWDTSPDPTVAGYLIYWGTVSGNYTDSEDAGTNTAITISNLAGETPFYFAAACYDEEGAQSGYSTEIAYTTPGAAAFAFSNLTQTYSGMPESVTVTTSPADLPVTVTYNGNTTAPVNAGAYAVVATAIDSNYVGSATNTLVISPEPVTVTLSGLAATCNGGAQAVTVTTSPPGLAVATTYNGSAAAPANIGSYAVAAIISDSNYTGSASGMLVISPATAALTVLANPTGAGSVTGGGLFDAGSLVAVTAATNSGYAFLSWTANGTVQSTSPNYSFALASNLNLIANFAAIPVISNTPVNTNIPVPIPVVNGSFEEPAGARGTVAGVPVGWVASNKDPYGVYNPAVGDYTNEVNDILPEPAQGSQVLWINAGNYVAQFLTNTLKANLTYTLSGAIGNRAGGYGMEKSDQDYVALVAGNTTIAEITNLVHPAPGSFLPWTISYTAPAAGFPSGPLQIRLGQSGAGEVNYDNIALTMTAPPGKTIMISSTTTVASSQNPALAGSLLTLTATVSGSGGIPTGTVAFFDGSNSLGAGALNSLGLAALSTEALSAAGSPHSITAVYGGDSAFDGSTSSVLSQIITNASAPTTITLLDANFAIPAGAQGSVEAAPAGWLASNKDPYGVYNPAVGVYLNEVNDILPEPVGSSQLLWILAGNYVAQFLTNTLEASQTYTLSGAIGNRGDGYGMAPSDDAYVALLAGDTIIAQNTNLPRPPPGGFLAWSISYTAPAAGFPSGPLQIRLGQSGVGEVDFGNIALTMSSPASATNAVDEAAASTTNAVADATASTSDATDSTTNATSSTTNTTAEIPGASPVAPSTDQTIAGTNSTILNPLISAAGTYNGLFYVPNNAADDSSGAVAVTVTTTGAFSANLRMDAASYPFSGQFSGAGAALESVPGDGSNSLTVQLQLSLTNGPLTGTVSNGAWTAVLMAEAAVYSTTNPAPQAGTYTLVLPGGDDASAQSGGSGTGTVTVSDSGDATFSGTLADGTPVTCAGTVSGQGQWPFYLPLPGGNGSILGWLSFTNQAASTTLISASASP